MMKEATISRHGFYCFKPHKHRTFKVVAVDEAVLSTKPWHQLKMGDTVNLLNGSCVRGLTQTAVDELLSGAPLTELLSVNVVSIDVAVQTVSTTRHGFYCQKKDSATATPFKVVVVDEAVLATKPWHQLKMGDKVNLLNGSCLRGRTQTAVDDILIGEMESVNDHNVKEAIISRHGFYCFKPHKHRTFKVVAVDEAVLSTKPWHQRSSSN
jgi:glutamine amidotransferase-like uncharacterized protein